MIITSNSGYRKPSEATADTLFFLLSVSLQRKKLSVLMLPVSGLPKALKLSSLNPDP